MGEEEKSLLSGVQCAQLFMPAGADSPSCKAGGLAQEVLGDLLEVVEFPDMEHGWSIRGGQSCQSQQLRTVQCSVLNFLYILDMKDPAVERDVKKTITGTLEFFAKHL